MGEKLFGRSRRWRFRERAPDVDASVVIGPADGGPPAGLDVDERGQVQLLGPRAVARLPDRKQLRQATAMRCSARCDGIERLRQRGGDLALVEIRRARLDIVVMRRQPVVVVGVDP
jgi:hypothetical protein